MTQARSRRWATPASSSGRSPPPPRPTRTRIRLAPSAATEVRLGHLAFIDGETTRALRHARAAVVAAREEGATGERSAFYHYQLADVLISTGDRRAARREYAAGVKADPGSFLAHSGLARVAAAEGDLDAAIKQLSISIAIVPQPDFLARRGRSLLASSAARGCGSARPDDYATVDAIARLLSDTANVYDRTLALYLANHGLDVHERCP